MERQQLDHYLGAFCHLDPERSFSFDQGLSLLCHRCTGIYSTFLLVALLGLVLAWRGQLVGLRSKKAVGVMAFVFLAICGVQVALQEWGPSWGGGEYARILTGGLVAIGLFQFSQLSGEGFPLPKGTWPQLLTILGGLGVHVVLLYQSFFYNTLVTVGGLIWLYHQINLQVLDPWIKGKNFFLRHGIIAVFIVLEWSFLYAINVLKIHV